VEPVLQTPDAELVERCLAQDHRAWESIVGQYRQRLHSLAYRFTGTFDEAEDLTQEIFLKVYCTLHSYRPELAALVTWIVRVGRNHIIDNYRKFKIERNQTDSLEVVYEHAEENSERFASPVQAIEQLELSERIQTALLRMPQDLREVVILRDLEEFTYVEIADRLKLPLGTVKSRINRGRTELARLLKYPSRLAHDSKELWADTSSPLRGGSG
jgi:RNA polymerase sigma-70 factor (ECF subfamily)